MDRSPQRSCNRSRIISNLFPTHSKSGPQPPVVLPDVWFSTGHHAAGPRCGGSFWRTFYTVLPSASPVSTTTEVLIACSQAASSLLMGRPILRLFCSFIPFLCAPAHKLTLGLAQVSMAHGLCHHGSSNNQAVGSGGKNALIFGSPISYTTPVSTAEPFIISQPQHKKFSVWYDHHNQEVCLPPESPRL